MIKSIKIPKSIIGHIRSGRYPKLLQIKVSSGDEYYKESGEKADPRIIENINGRNVLCSHATSHN